MVPPSQNSNQHDADRSIDAGNESHKPSIQRGAGPDGKTSANDQLIGETHASEPLTQADAGIESIPSEFGRYRIEVELGRGGMGVVFLAHDRQLDRKVAIKIPFLRGDDSAAAERFRREARAMATVQHANLCPIYDVGQFEKWQFLTMAFIDGQSLSQTMTERRLSVIQSAALLKTVAEALHEAHRAGITHRDLKPSNIMLDERSEPTVMDFGLARRDSAGEAEITHSRTVLGSPAYMAPEQVESRHDEVGPATDVYAMGIIFYQMVTGQRPFQGSTAAVFGQIVTREPEPPSKLCNELPPAIDEICLKAIAKAPADRYSSAAEFANALSDFLAGADRRSPALSAEYELSSEQTSAESSSDNPSSTRRSRDAERRQLTVMICNCDSEDPEHSLASLDPEDQRDLLRSTTSHAKALRFLCPRRSVRGHHAEHWIERFKRIETTPGARQVVLMMFVLAVLRTGSLQLALLLVAIVSLPMARTNAQSRPTTLTFKTVEDTEIQVDVYEPDAEGPRPTVAWFHGGALIMGSRAGIPKQLIELCQSQGFLLVSFDYRLGPHAKLPEIIEDLEDGVTWLRSLGRERFNADPDRLVVAGASAGGYLAMMSGFVLDPPPTAVVSYYGFGDIDGQWTTEPNENYLAGTPITKEDAWDAVGDELVTHTDQGTGRARWKFFVYLKQTGLWTKTLTGFDPSTEREKLKPFSPIRNLTRQYPPLLMLHGTADQDVPYQQSEAMARELSRLGRPHELITLHGGRHGLWGGPPEKVVEAVDRSMEFIKEHLSAP